MEDETPDQNSPVIFIFAMVAVLALIVMFAVQQQEPSTMSSIESGHHD